MKKKIIAMTLYIALLLTSLIPVTALAVGDTEGGAEPPVCTCTTKCSEGNVNSGCLVCSAEVADLSVCKGQEPQQEDEQGGGDENDVTPAPAPSPVCTCTAKCAEGSLNDQCPV